MELSKQAKNFISITDNCNSPMIIEDGLRNLPMSVQNELIRYYYKQTNGAVTNINTLAITMASVRI